jgi:hypothetical protein
MIGIHGAIEIMNGPDANLFHLLGERNLQIIWTLITQLIFATDHACQFRVMHDLQALIDFGEFDPSDEVSPRLLIMKLLLRFADMARMIKPIHPRELWMCGVIQGFHRTAEVRGCSAFVFTVSVVNFESLDQQASVMPFLQDICLPMVKLVVRIAPPLEIQRQHFETWSIEYFSVTE